MTFQNIQDTMPNLEFPFGRVVSLALAVGPLLVENIAGNFQALVGSMSGWLRKPPPPFSGYGFRSPVTSSRSSFEVPQLRASDLYRCKGFWVHELSLFSRKAASFQKR